MSRELEAVRADWIAIGEGLPAPYIDSIVGSVICPNPHYNLQHREYMGRSGRITNRSLLLGKYETDEA
jgi:hypothetical protein